MAQASLFVFIPNQLPSRQEKSLELYMSLEHTQIKSKVENWSKAEVLSGVESIRHRESVFYYPAFAILSELDKKGMTKDELIASFGKPPEIIEDGKYEVFIFDNCKPKSYYFKDGVLEKTQ